MFVTHTHTSFLRITKPYDALRSVNPQGKVPVLVDAAGMKIPESDTILRYIIDKYADQGPSYRPSTLEARTKSDLICRFHDMYITTIQVLFIVFYRSTLCLL